MHKDDPSYDAECLLELPMGVMECSKFSKHLHTKTEMKNTKVKVYGDKYTFENMNGVIECRRYGEPWMHFTEGCNAVLALMSEVLELRKELGKNKKGET